MSWLKDKVNNLVKNEDSALNKLLDGKPLGTVAEVGMETKSIVLLGVTILIAGILLMIVYKRFIQK